jgi:P-type Ca2+ transporter type 2C
MQSTLPIIGGQTQETSEQAQGLSEADAARQFKLDGPNELPSAKPRTLFYIALGVVQEPMFLLLGPEQT